MSEKIVVYGSDLCPMVPPVRSLLQRADVAYDYISISRSRTARQRVMEINQGQRAHPGLSRRQHANRADTRRVDDQTAGVGHTIAPETRWQGVILIFESPRILNYSLIFLAIGLTFKVPSLTFAGSVLLVLALLGRMAGMIGRR